MVDRTEPSCRGMISESGWQQHSSCSSNPTKHPSEDNHTKLQSRHKANMGMQGIPRTLELGLWPDTSLGAPIVPSFTALSLVLKPPTDCLCLFNSSLPQELQLLPETPGMSLVPPLQILRRPSGQEHKADSKAKLTALAEPCFLHFWLCQKCYWEPVK